MDDDANDDGAIGDARADLERDEKRLSQKTSGKMHASTVAEVTRLLSNAVADVHLTPLDSNHDVGPHARFPSPSHHDEFTMNGVQSVALTV